MAWGQCRAILLHWYGYSEEEIDNLTLPQFRQRMADVVNVKNYLSGSGKGRVRRDRRQHLRVMAQAGRTPPADWVE